MKNLTAILFLVALYASLINGCKENPTTPSEIMIPAPPTNLHYDTLGQTAIQLYWTASETSQDSVKNYLLTISNQNDTIIIDKDISTYTITGLTPNTQYTLTLRTKAINNQLSEPASVVISTSYATLPPPTGLMANSQDSQTVRLKWTAPLSVTDADFSGYELTVTPDSEVALPAITISKSATTYDIPGLTEGKIYTFSLKSKSTATQNNTSTAAVVQWSPATRYTNVRLYESASNLIGSGYNLSKNRVLAISNISQWDIGLDTRAVYIPGVGEVTSYDIGSPNLTSYPFSSIKTTLVSSKRYENVTSLDDVFDTQVLGPNSPLTPETERLVTFYRDKEYMLGGEKFPLVAVAQNFLFFAKTEEGNYSKILVKVNKGTILQGTAPNRYIEMDISYQTVANIPYALTHYKDSQKSGIQAIPFKTAENSPFKKGK